MNADLNQLRDIHLPAPISWWPPAPGWWALLIGAALLCAGFIFWYRRYRQNRWRREALQELNRLQELHQSHQAEPQAIVIALSVLLRRVAISRFPRKDVAALNGDAWLTFLDRTLGDGAAFMSENGRLLAVAPYLQHAHLTSDSLCALLAMSERWFKTLPSRCKK